MILSSYHHRPLQARDDGLSLRAAVPFRRQVCPRLPLRLVSWEWWLIFDYRLYFTSFPHPAPRPEVLNRNEVENMPHVPGQARATTSATPDDDAKYYYFTIDDQLLYLSFFQDWGPLNLAMVYKACILIHELLQV